MAIYKENYVQIKLEEGNIHRTFVNKTIGEGDANAIDFGGYVTRNDRPVDLTGCTVKGYFIRADGTSVIINGTVSGNAFHVRLISNCFTVEGNFTLAIKLTGGGVTGTMRIVDGTVVNTVIGPVVDPNENIPDLSELMAVIGRAEAAAETIGEFIITEELISGDNYRLIVDVEE